MKTPRLTLALLTACAVLPASGLFAQSAGPAVPSTTPSVSAPAGTTDPSTEEEGGKGGNDRKFYDSLTPEEKQKVRAAHKVAMQDPAVQAAKADKSNRRAFHRAVVDAMIKADPSVAAILEKRKEERHPGKNQ